jgi:membrane associated rhomboid family serine protease
MVTIILIVVTAAISWLAFERPAIVQRLILWPPAIERNKQFDRLLTHGFIHADFSHLLFNMITLFFFGRVVERVMSQYIGPVGYLLFYLSAIVVAILPTYMQHRHDARYSSLGASGSTRGCGSWRRCRCRDSCTASATSRIRSGRTGRAAATSTTAHTWPAPLTA